MTDITPSEAIHRLRIGGISHPVEIQDRYVSWDGEEIMRFWRVNIMPDGGDHIFSTKYLREAVNSALEAHSTREQE